MLDFLRQLLADLRRPVSPGRPFLEVQVHPGDIRRKVRYLFLSRGVVVGAGVVLCAWLCLVAVGLAIGPGAVSDWFASGEYAEREAEREALAERMETLVGELSTLEAQTEDTRLQMEKIHLVYGIAEQPALGKGGYPRQPASLPQQLVPQSVHAATVRRGNGLEARIGEQLDVLDTFLDEVASFEVEHRDQVRSTPSVTPLERESFVLTSPYGYRTSPFTQERDFHPGLDMAAAEGTPIVAPAAGTVAFAGRYPLKQSVGWWRYGNLVVIRHGDRFISLHGHCDEVRVRTGQTVERGDVIATVGNTGWSTSAHLHYEIRRLGDDGKFQPVDPRIYMLDQRWRAEERLLIQARDAPAAVDFEPLPRRFGR